MKRPGLFWCLVAAFAGAALVSGIQSLVWPWLGGTATLRLMAVALPLAYMALLLALAEAKVGRVVLAAMAGVVALAVFVGPVSLPVVLAVEIAMIWVVRSLCFHKSVTSALIDGVVAALGVAVALMAFASTRSLATAAWSALLVQAAVVYIPDRWGRVDAKAAGAAEPDMFHRAYQAADHALRDLAAR